MIVAGDIELLVVPSCRICPAKAEVGYCPSLGPGTRRLTAFMAFLINAHPTWSLATAFERLYTALTLDRGKRIGWGYNPVHPFWPLYTNVDLSAW